MYAFRRTMATMAPQASALKQAGKVVCIGRNFAYVIPFTFWRIELIGP
jgi:hypothetical protein